MTRLSNNLADFADEAITGLVAAHQGCVRPVSGGVARSTETPQVPVDEAFTNATAAHAERGLGTPDTRGVSLSLTVRAVAERLGTSSTEPVPPQPWTTGARSE